MPALSPSLRGVFRNESTRSDSSNTSHSSANKKVSFNKAVRVKKVPRKSTPSPPDDQRSKRFWFRVHKSPPRHPQVIHYDDDGGYRANSSPLNYPAFTSDCGTQTAPRQQAATILGNEFTPLHPSQMPSDPPEVRRNYVKKIVNRFNEEAVLQRRKSPERYSSDSPPISPPGSPRMYSTPKSIPIPPPPPPPSGSLNLSDYPPLEGLFTNPRPKKNPVNGVKVMFGSDDEKKNRSDNAFRSYGNPDFTNGGSRKPYKSEVHHLSDGSETEVKSSPQRSFHFGDLDHHNEMVKRNSNMDLTTIRRGNGHYHGNGNGYHFDSRDDSERKPKYHFETFDSGNQLLFDTTDVNTATKRTDEGEFVSTVGEKHQLWRNNKRMIVYEEPPSPTIIRRKAKSQSDLTIREEQELDKLDKGISTVDLSGRKTEEKDTLSKSQKDSWFRNLRSGVKDKGIQCNKVPTDEPEELYGFGRYRIIRPRNGVVSAFSNVPKIDKHTIDKDKYSASNGYDNKESSVIYSQIDKSKKKRDKEKKKGIFSEEGRIGSLFKSRSEPLYIGPPPKSPQHVEDEIDGGSFYNEDGERIHPREKVKTSKRSFGFRINTGKEDLRPYYEEDWYNVDGDVEAVERQKRRGRHHRDIAEVRHEIAEEEISDGSSLSNGDRRRNGTGSVMRGVDFKKKEISYENVPRSDDERNSHNGVTTSGMWYRDADEDYRREMAQNEVSYPAGSSVGSDRFYTVDRRDKSSKKPPPSPRAYTLDRRHLKSKDRQKSPVPNTSGVKILVNGKEVKEKSSSGKKLFKKREDPSSVQSDPMFVRGGLAAAYQARQRSAVRRSNSSVSGLNSRYGSTPNIRRIVASSEASSGSESSRQHRPLVMYIPGVSHPEKSADKEDRMSTIARSQSMMSQSRPTTRTTKRSGHKGHKGSKVDLYRNGDIYEEDEIMPLASDNGRKKPPRVPSDSRKSSNIKRSQSMPKDTKFSWLKWKIRGKPSREP